MKKQIIKQSQIVKNSLEVSYYSKCARILKAFSVSKSEKKMYNALKKLNETGREYIETLSKKNIPVRSLPKWENIILCQHC